MRNFWKPSFRSLSQYCRDSIPTNSNQLLHACAWFWWQLHPISGHGGPPGSLLKRMNIMNIVLEHEDHRCRLPVIFSREHPRPLVSSGDGAIVSKSIKNRRDQGTYFTHRVETHSLWTQFAGLGVATRRIVSPRK